MITAFISGQSLRLSTTKIVAGSNDYLELRAIMQTGDWSQLNTWAHFTQDGKNIYDLELHDGCISRNQHLNLSAGDWMVHFTGLDLDSATKITTEQQKLTVQATGCVCGTFPDVPPSHAEQVTKDAAEARRLAKEALDTVTDNLPLTERAEAAAIAAESSAKQAGTFSQNAKLSEANASAAKSTAVNAATAAGESANSAAASSENAKGHSESAAGYASAAERSFQSAAKSEQAAERSKNAAAASATEARQSAERASGSAQNASGDSRRAQTAAAAAEAAKEVVVASEATASAAATTATEAAGRADASAKSASTDAGKAATSATQATESAKTAKAEADRATGMLNDTTISPDTAWSSAKIAQTFAPALTNTVSGSVIAVDDVSPLEHQVGCRVESKNILPFPYFDGGAGESFTDQGITFSVLDDGKIYVSGKNTSDRVINFAMTDSGSAFDFKTKTLGVSFKVTGNKQNVNYIFGLGDFEFVTITANKTYNGMSTSGTKVVYNIIQVSPAAEVDCICEPMVCVGSLTELQPYTPYIPDLSAVTVSRYGGNLAKINRETTFPYYAKPNEVKEIDPTKTYVGVAASGYFYASAVSVSKLDINSAEFIPNTAGYGIGIPFILPIGFKGYIGGNFSTPGALYVMFMNADGQFIGNAKKGEFMVPQGCKYTMLVCLSLEVIDGVSFENVFLSSLNQFCPYAGEDIYSTSPDGTVTGMTSLSPDMTILTDNPGAVVTAEYNADTKLYIDHKFAELQAAILSGGANI